MLKASVAPRQSGKLLSASTAEVRSATDLHAISFSLPCNFPCVPSLTLPGLFHAPPLHSCEGKSWQGQAGDVGRAGRLAGWELPLAWTRAELLLPTWQQQACERVHVYLSRPPTYQCRELSFTALRPLLPLKFV